MKVVIAPDSFKESLSAVEVASAMAEGVRDVAADAIIDLCPMADGGEGTVEALVSANCGQFRTTTVCGPLGERRIARWGLLPRRNAAEPGPVAVIEMAEAAGLVLVPPEQRNPLKTTTYGVGQLIRAALDEGAGTIIIGIGGSATTDGGAGYAEALGVVFIDRAVPVITCGMGGGDLARLGNLDATDVDPRLAGCEILVACDVNNPLTGPNGAAVVYGPQKGATPEMVRQLDQGLANLAELIRRRLKLDIEQLPGAGAAGGLGAGLVAFAGAKLQRGIEIVAEAMNLAPRVAAADLVLTGEGKFDSQSAAGKTAVGVARVAHAQHRPVLCVPGQATADAPHELFAGVHPLVAGQVSVQQALANPAQLLRRRTAEAVQAFLAANAAK